MPAGLNAQAGPGESHSQTIPAGGTGGGNEAGEAVMTAATKSH